MAEDVAALAHFYASPHGRVVIAMLRARLRALWPIRPGARMLGLGYALPFLRIWRTEAGDCTIACLPAQLGVARWPRKRPSLATVVHEDRLPFPDLLFDRVLLVHGLEHAEHARRMLREVWRVLKDDGRLMVVVPNRTGWWAYAEATPFGHGRPFSAPQLSRLLASAMFREVRRDGALFVPPFPWRTLLRGAAAWERVGRRIGPRFAGVAIIEAEKDLFGAIPLPVDNSVAVRRRPAVLAADAG
ncbi:MAG: class I SAM-dependent methyltransferase [Elioraea sp.]|nr:class I SAM-dependent methyltransferase [Elioraea sp.]